MCHSCNFGAINCFVCLSSDLIQWNKQVCSLSTIFIEASLEPYTISITFQLVCTTLVENPPFCNYIFNYYSTTNIVENYKNSCKLFFAIGKCFSQLQISKVDKYKLKVSLQSKVYATCQHHNNSHYVLLLTNLVENCSTNIVKGCCQLHSTSG